MWLHRAQAHKAGVLNTTLNWISLIDKTLHMFYFLCIWAPLWMDTHIWKFAHYYVYLTFFFFLHNVYQKSYLNPYLTWGGCCNPPKVFFSPLLNSLLYPKMTFGHCFRIFLPQIRCKSFFGQKQILPLFFEFFKVLTYITS